MTYSELVDSIPEYAKELRLNLGSVMEQSELTAEQAWGTAVACALAARNRELYRAVLDALQTDELCPCNWHKGEQVLKPAV